MESWWCRIVDERALMLRIVRARNMVMTGRNGLGKAAMSDGVG